MECHEETPVDQKWKPGMCHGVASMNGCQGPLQTRGTTAMVRDLLQAGANPFLTDEDGLMPLALLQ